LRSCPPREACGDGFLARGVSLAGAAGDVVNANPRLPPAVLAPTGHSGNAVAAASACAANPVLCLNNAGITTGEIVAGGAMPAGTGAVVTASAVGSLVEGEAAALRRLAQNPAGPTLTGKGSRTILQLQSQRRIDELACTVQQSRSPTKGSSNKVWMERY